VLVETTSTELVNRKHLNNSDALLKSKDCLAASEG
jgi:hypothetical protein